MAYWWEEYVPYIQAKEKETGIPTSVVLAQMTLESGGTKKSGLASKDNNLFGIKGAGSNGTAYYGSAEYINGKWSKPKSGFASYNSPLESIDAYINLISKERYTSQYKNAKTINDFFVGIWKGGYATDPKYPGKLNSQVSSYGLDKYNVNKEIKFIGGSSTTAPLTPGSGLVNTGVGSNILDPLVGFFKEAQINALKFAIYTILFIVGIWFFFQAINSVPVVKEGVKQTRGATNTTKRVVKTAVKVATKIPIKTK